MTKEKIIKLDWKVGLAFDELMPLPLKISNAYVLILNIHRSKQYGRKGFNSFEQIAKVLNQVSNKNKSLIIFSNGWSKLIDDLSVTPEEIIDTNIDRIYKSIKNLEKDSFFKSYDKDEQHRIKVSNLKYFKFELLLNEYNLFPNKRNRYYIPKSGKIEIFGHMRRGTQKYPPEKYEIGKIKIYPITSNMMGKNYVSDLAKFSGATIIDKIDTPNSIDIKHLGFVKKIVVNKKKIIVS